MSNKLLVFVYGTLKRGYRNNFLLQQEGCKFIGVVKTRPKYRLYDAGGCPMMIEVPEGKIGVCIEGELWEVTDEVLSELDCLENAPHSYIRKQISILGHSSECILGYVFRHKKMARMLPECSPSWSPPMRTSKVKKVVRHS